MAEADTVVNTPNPAPAPEPSEEDIVAGALAEDTAEPSQDEDEIEFKGEKIKVPKLIAQRVREHDAAANRKMMDAAEERKSVERDRAAFAETQRTFNAVAKDYAALEQVGGELDKYKDFIEHPEKWAQFFTEDATEAAKHQAYFNGLLAKQRKLGGELQQKVAAAQSAERTAQETSTAENRKAVQAAIKGWSPEAETALKAAASEHYKLPAQYLAMVGNDPYATQVLNDAITYRRALAKTKSMTAKAKAETEVEAEPIKKVGGTAAATKDPEKMTGDEYMKWRNAQIAARQRPRKRI